MHPATSTTPPIPPPLLYPASPPVFFTLLPLPPQLIAHGHRWMLLSTTTAATTTVLVTVATRPSNNAFTDFDSSGGILKREAPRYVAEVQGSYLEDGPAVRGACSVGADVALER